MGSSTFICKCEEYSDRIFKNFGASADMNEGHGPKRMVRKALRCGPDDGQTMAQYLITLE